MYIYIKCSKSCEKGNCRYLNHALNKKNSRSPRQGNRTIIPARIEYLKSNIFPVSEIPPNQVYCIYMKSNAIFQLIKYLWITENTYRDA